MAARESSSTDGGDLAWVLMPADAVPQRWRGRSVPLALVPFAPAEVSRLLAGEEVPAELSAEELSIARLLAVGAPIRSIGRTLGLSDRTVQRRLGRMRKALDVRTTAELAAELARRGF